MASAKKAWSNESQTNSKHLERHKHRCHLPFLIFFPLLTHPPTEEDSEIFHRCNVGRRDLGCLLDFFAMFCFVYLFSLMYPGISPQMAFISNLHLLIIPQSNLKWGNQYAYLDTGHIVIMILGNQERKIKSERTEKRKKNIFFKNVRNGKIEVNRGWYILWYLNYVNIFLVLLDWDLSFLLFNK